MKLIKPITAPGFDPNHPGNSGNGVVDSWVTLGNSNQLTSLLTGKSTTNITGTTFLRQTQFGPAIDGTSGSVQAVSRVGALSTANMTMACIAIMKANAASCILLSTSAVYTAGSFNIRVQNLDVTAFVAGSVADSLITLQLDVPYFIGYSWGHGYSNNANFVVVNLLTGKIQTATVTAGNAAETIQNIGIAGITGYHSNAYILTAMLSSSAIGLENMLKWVNDDPFSFWYPDNKDPLFFGKVGSTLSINNTSFAINETPDAVAVNIKSLTQVQFGIHEQPDNLNVNITSRTNTSFAINETPDAVHVNVTNGAGIGGGAYPRNIRQQLLIPPLSKPGFDATHPANEGHGVIDSWFVSGNSSQFTSIFTGQPTTTLSGTPGLVRTKLGPAVNGQNGTCVATSRVGAASINTVTLAAVATILVNTANCTLVGTNSAYPPSSGEFQLRVDNLSFNAGHSGVIFPSGLTLTIGVPYFLSFSYDHSHTATNLNFAAVNLNTGQIFTSTVAANTVSTTINNFCLNGRLPGAYGNANMLCAMASSYPIGLDNLVKWINKGVFSFWYPDDVFTPLRQQVGFGTAPTTINFTINETPDNVLVSIYNAVSPPIPQTGTFPPSGPTTQTEVIPSYLYQQYTDDDDLQAFVASYNTIAQEYINTLNGLNLPIYTGLSDSLLDWVGAGLYGYPRPALFSFMSQLIGPLNTWELNSIKLDFSETIGQSNVLLTTDDFYKRLLTWYLFRGDGKYFTIRWLKRRIMRFLIGTDGSSPNIDQTYQISVTFGSNNTIAISFIDYTIITLASAQLNNFELNTTMLNFTSIEQLPIPPLPNRDVFQDAVISGAIELPFQYIWDVQL